jgi:hypothetical protein
VQIIYDIKSEYIASDKVKLAAKIKFDLQELTQNVLTEMEMDIEQFAKDPLVRAELRKLFEKSIGYMLTYTTTIVQDLEDDLKKVYPYVSEIDLEQSLDNIHKDFPLRRNKK